MSDQNTNKSADAYFADLEEARAQEKQRLDRVKTVLIKSRLPLTRIALRRLWWGCIALLYSRFGCAVWRVSDFFINIAHSFIRMGARADDRASNFAYRSDYWGDVTKELRANE